MLANSPNAYLEVNRQSFISPINRLVRYFVYTFSFTHLQMFDKKKDIDNKRRMSLSDKTQITEQIPVDLT